MRATRSIPTAAGLVGLAITVSLCACPGRNVPAWSISGTVSGAVSQGVTVTLGGASSAAVTTDALGHYAFTDLAEGSYTVTPSLTGYVFDPAIRSVSLSGADVSGQDFTASVVFYVISGTVSGAASQGVTVTLGGTSSATATTDASGHYAFAGVASGNYTVTPSLAGYTFEPPDWPVSVIGADVGGRDFTASALPHILSGAVSGAVLAGVSVALSGATSAATITEASGHYVFAGLADGNYSVTPSLTGFTFDPASRAVSMSGADVSGQDFVASLVSYAISGTVSGAVSQGVTVTLTGASSATTGTDVSGYYVFAGLAHGTYTVTPSRPGYAFSPAKRTVSVSGADVGRQDFVASVVPHAISGYVSGAVSAGVTVTLGWGPLLHQSSATTTTDAVGHYTFAGLADGYYTLLPSLPGYRFTPTIGREVLLSGANVDNQNFTAIAARCPTSSGCNDFNPCTADSCDPTACCVFTAMGGLIKPGTPCRDEFGHEGTLVYSCLAGVLGGTLCW